MGSREAAIRSFMICGAAVSTEDGIIVRENNISLVKLGNSKGSARNICIRLLPLRMGLRLKIEYRSPRQFHESVTQVPGNARAVLTPLHSSNSRLDGPYH